MWNLKTLPGSVDCAPHFPNCAGMQEKEGEAGPCLTDFAPEVVFELPR